MARIQRPQRLITHPTQPFQEVVCLPRHADKKLAIHHMTEHEKKVISILERTRNPNTKIMSFGIMTCENQDVLKTSKNKNSYEEMIKSVIENHQNERVFYSDSDEIRKIAFERALQHAASEAQNGKTQSFLMFDINDKGNLVCRGGGVASCLDNELNIQLFVATDLCESFEILHEPKSFKIAN